MGEIGKSKVFFKVSCCIKSQNAETNGPGGNDHICRHGGGLYYLVAKLQEAHKNNFLLRDNITTFLRELLECADKNMSLSAWELY